MSALPQLVPPNPDSTGNDNSFTTIRSHNDNNSADSNTSCPDANTNNITVIDDRSTILTWLSPLEPNLRHYDVRMRRIDEVGGWVLETEEFRRWYRGCGQGESQKATIFCSGNPGVGKTYISSLVIDTLCNAAGEARERNTTVACFYFDFATRKEQTATNILGALLKQVAGGFKPIPREIVDSFERQNAAIGGRRLALPEIVKILGNLASLRRTFLCLDAIDECTALDRVSILNSLRDIIEMSPMTRVFITGRSHVVGEVQKRLPRGAALVTIRPWKYDLIRYIHRKLDEDTAPDEMDEELEAEILEKVPESVGEIFRLVSLNLDAILQETTVHRRRERLRATTDGLILGDAYDATLDRIKVQGGQKSRLGMAALMWISHSERPLGAEELCQALAVEIGSTEYNADNASSISTLLNSCQGLAEVDEEGSAIRLVHRTLREYLTSHPDVFRNPHATIAETCLTYLNSQPVIAHSATDIGSTQHRPFLEYSALYWGTHMSREASDRGHALAMGLFSHCENHVSVKLILEHTLGYSLYSIAEPYKFTGLHCVSMFGLVELARALMQMDGVDINCVDDLGATPLGWASKEGHEGVVKLLLAQENVNPNWPDNYGRTPISLAAGRGHDAVMRLFMGRQDINLDGPSNSGRTPVPLPAGDGLEAAAKLLMGRQDISRDRPTTTGRTSIPWEVGGGHEVAVGLLMPDDHGRTLISYAAAGGHVAAVNLLLGRQGVNPDAPCDSGRTPISWAAGGGHEPVIKLLMGQQEVNPDRPDNHGRTPISYAAGGGYEAVVRLLIRREDINPDRPDNSGRTPISWAAGYGYVGVVDLLMGKQNVNPDGPCNSGRTPISWAAGFRREGVVKLLMDRQDVNLDKPDNCGRTPISWAAGCGCEPVVKRLIGQQGINPDKPDICGRTPISYAAEYGYLAAVDLLMGQQDVNPDRPDNYGRTPISWAAGGRQEPTVKLLMGRRDVNPDRRDNCGRTPISYAAEYGHLAAVDLLMVQQDVNPDRPDNCGRTPISWAAGGGQEPTVKLLMGRRDVNPDRRDNYGRTPISWAAGGGREPTVRLLMGQQDVNPDRPDNCGRTPISYAAEYGHLAVVDLLMVQQDVNPDRPDNFGRTPISYAASGGHVAAANLLMR